MSLESLFKIRKTPEKDFQEKFVKWLESLKVGFVHEIQYLARQYSKKRGIPDVFFYCNGSTYAFELKSKKGVVSAIQQIRHDELKKVGVKVYVLNPDTFAEFKVLFEEKLKK